MSLLPSLTGELQDAVKERGIPLPAVDDEGKMYMLLNVECTADTVAGGYVARVPTINAFGEGDTEEEATIALTEALRGYLETFS
jgi:predicted RNase H-like HicB family nuclease